MNCGILLMARAVVCIAAATGILLIDPANAYPQQNGFTEHFDAASPNFHMADGWTNGGPFNAGWRADHVTFASGLMSITVDNTPCPSGCSNMPYAAGEYRTNDLYGYGRYEVRMKPAKYSGAMTGALFTYTDCNDGNPWDEIDIEFLGNNTNVLQTNYITNGVGIGSHETVVNLGFDASLAFHTYAFEWTPSYIKWYVDGALKVTEDGSRGALPAHAGRIMLNAWPGTGVNGWLGPFTYTGLFQAQYDWVTFTPIPSVRAQFPYLHSFGADQLSDPHDVAVYAPNDRKQYIFVADSGTEELVRFRFDGHNAIPTLHISANLQGGSIDAVAVNDIPGHCNQGQVYVTEIVGSGFNALIHVFDLDGVVKMDLVPTLAGGFYGPLGIACDTYGNVYVTDRIKGRTLKFNASWFDPSNYNTSLLAVPDRVFDAFAGSPTDVSVDLNGFVHVTYESNRVVRYRPDGALESILVSPGPASPIAGNLWGIDATDPSGHVWVGHGDVQRYAYDMAGVPTQDFESGTSGLSFASGVEYKKFLVLQLTGPGLKTSCQERMFVCDSGHHEIDVFGESTSSAVIPDGAVAWWRLGETHNACPGRLAIVRDSVGVNDGFVTGVFPTPVTCEGAVGSALRFDTLGGMVEVPDAPALNFGTVNFTVEGWLRMRQATGLFTALDKRVGEGAGYSVYVYNGKIGIQINGGSGVYQNWTNANGEVADGGWHHFAFVVSRSTTTITGYVDGVATSGPLSSTLAGLSVTTPASLLIGAHNSSSTHFLGGIDELTLYNRTLSCGEIATIMSAQFAGKQHSYRWAQVSSTYDHFPAYKQ